MGKIIWTCLVGLGVVIGVVTTKYFKIDEIQARQMRFEERTEKRMTQYDLDLSKVRVDSTVSAQLLIDIKGEVQDVKRIMLNAKR